MKNVLVVEQDPVVLQTVTALLKSRGSFLNILSAQDGKAAFKVIAQNQIHIVITGLHMSEMEGFDLVLLLSRQCPDIRIIVMADNASPMFRAQIKQIPTAVHFDPSTDVDLLTDRVFTELHINYGGQVRGLSISSFLQMLTLEGHDCELYIHTKGKTGRLHIVDGELVAAETGLLKGNAAALQILSWKNVSIEIDYSLQPVDRDITQPLMALLLESGRIVDERDSSRPNLRKNDRFECLVAVDYDMSDWTYQCFLRDISVGGAYIETGKPIKVGQTVALTLSCPGIEPGCTIKGQVVRRDEKGIGLQFPALDAGQETIIQALISGDHIRRV